MCRRCALVAFMPFFFFKESFATNSLPMSGCVIEAVSKEDAVALGKDMDKSSVTFKLSAHNRSYFIRTKDNADIARYLSTNY